MILQRSFYEKDTLIVAKELLGKLLVHQTEVGTLVGRIVETEAYLGSMDPAAHSYKGQTQRTRAMFGSSGHAYIYFTYGMYYCFNVVAGGKQNGEGVLIRAIEPLTGIEQMKQNRKTEKEKNLTNGPGKLVIAMGITKDLYGHDLTTPPLYLDEDLETKKEFKIVETTRIGISQAKDLAYRFYIKDNPWISRK